MFRVILFCLLTFFLVLQQHLLSKFLYAYLHIDKEWQKKGVIKNMRRNSMVRQESVKREYLPVK